MSKNSKVICGQSVDRIEKMSFDDMKEILLEYVELDREIDNEIERLERLDEKIKSVGSPNMSGMPHNSNSSFDKIGKNVSKKIDLENHIKELIKERDRTLGYIESLISVLKKADERAVLRMRYIDQEDWKYITYSMFGNKKNYDYNLESYKQRVFRLHKSAIINLIDIYINSDLKTE